MSSQIPTVAKAWRFPSDQSSWNSYLSLELRDVAVTPPGKGEVLVKLHAAALNNILILGWDIMFSKDPPSDHPLTNGPDEGGLIPTCDGAGKIVAIGEGVSEWKVGDRVHSLLFENWPSGPFKTEYSVTMLGSSVQGCLSQYRTFPAGAILPIPDHLSYEEAATLPCAGVTAWDAIFGKHTVNKDSSILVLGSGGVSIFGAQLAKAAGARVIATTSNEAKAARHKELGVDYVINYRETPNWSDKVRELTGGVGVDQVIEIGGQGTLIQSIKSVKQGGVVNLIGYLAQDGPSATLNDIANLLIFGQVTLTGIAAGSKEAAQGLDSFISEHKIKPALDSRVFGWTEAVEAFKYLESGSHFGKVVIRVD